MLRDRATTYRLLSHYTHSKIADFVGIHRVSVGNIIKGRTEPSLATFERLNEFLDAMEKEFNYEQ